MTRTVRLIDDLSADEYAFVLAYVKKPNASEAIREAGYEGVWPDQAGSTMLSKPKVRAAIVKMLSDRQRVAEIDAKWVLEQWLKIATADPDELVKHQRRCCRHCWGFNHHYQWRDGLEYATACDSVMAHRQSLMDQRKDPGELKLPSFDGGVGFKATRKPHPECTHCDGDGTEIALVADTRELSESGKLLYAGVKKTKDGIQVLMRDQDAALLNIAKYLGMHVNLQDVPKDSSLKELLKSMTPGTLLPVKK